jgi:hypothetical protein
VNWGICSCRFFSIRRWPAIGRFSINDGVESTVVQVDNPPSPCFWGCDGRNLRPTFSVTGKRSRLREKKKRLAQAGGKAVQPEKPESVLAGVFIGDASACSSAQAEFRAAHVGFDWPEMGGLLKSWRRKRGS